MGIVQDCLEAFEIQLLSECSQRRRKKNAPSSGKVVLCNACASVVSELGTGVQRGHFFNDSAFLNGLPKASGWCLVQASPLRTSPAVEETAAMPRASLAEDFLSLQALCQITVWVVSPPGSTGPSSDEQHGCGCCAEATDSLICPLLLICLLPCLQRLGISWDSAVGFP